MKQYKLRDKKQSIPEVMLKDMLKKGGKTLRQASLDYGRSQSYFNQALRSKQFRSVEIDFLMAYCSGEPTPSPIEVDKGKVSMMCKDMGIKLSKFCSQIDAAPATFQNRTGPHTKSTYILASGQLMALEKIGISREYIKEYMDGKNATAQAQSTDVELKTVGSIDNEISELEEYLEHLNEIRGAMETMAKRLKELREDVYNSNYRIGGNKT